MSIQEIKRAAFEFLIEIHRYSMLPRGENDIAFPFYLYFSRKFDNVTREYRVGNGFIDFRFGGNNPIVMELAVRPPEGRNQLFGPQNRNELMKLCRVPQAQARLRALLLLDLDSSPYDPLRLKRTYSRITAGRGYFKSVRVIYVHRDHEFDFLWSP